MMARAYITAGCFHLGLQDSFCPLRSAELVSLNAQHHLLWQTDAHGRETFAMQRRQMLND
jgi:hypothetical protein